MSERSVLDVLIAARERISDERRWTQRTEARTKFGLPVSATSERAVRWCAAGALWVDVRNPSPCLSAWTVLDRVSEALGFDDIVGVNDQAGHAAVLRVYDRAIENARAATGATESGGQP